MVKKRSGLAALLAAALLSAAPVQSEVRLTNETGGSYQVKVMSWWEIPFRTVVRQRYDFSCGSAALATLLTHHYGRPTPEGSAFSTMWNKGDRNAIRKIGFSMLDMKRYLDGIGYKTAGYRLTSDQLKHLTRPGIVLLDLKGYKHFVVLKGVRNGRVLVGDPTLGLGEYSLRDFDKIWNGILLAVVKTPEPFEPKFNLASDWGPWSSAPLEQAALHVPISAVTDNLPTEWQISSETLLGVRVGTVTR